MSLRLSSADCALAAIALCGLLLFGAQIMEHRFAMDPCPMCLMQRLWIFIAALAAYAGLAHNPRWGIYPLLTIVAALVGGGGFGPPALAAIERPGRKLRCARQLHDRKQPVAEHPLRHVLR